MDQPEIVVVGGGIGGASLATALASDGREVLVLEATEQYDDRVRGESMMPWGVVEARALGVEDVLLGAGAHVAATWLHYDAAVPTEVTEANPIPAGMLIPDVPGSMNLRHPVACQALIDAATAAGATVERGIHDVVVEPGPTPTVSYTTASGDVVDITARLVVGADGRNSAVRRQLGIPLHRQEETHMIAGLLVEGLDDVPDGSDFLASEGDLFMASFFQGHGRLRVYLVPAVSQKSRFAGPNGVAEFLRSAAFSCIPFGDRLADATPAGPLATYPGDDSWTDEPFVEGVVLVGDAGGWNDPIIGQGLSIAMRDARWVRDIVRGGDLSPRAFADYATERDERLRRLRYIADVMGAAMGDECPNRTARRATFFDLQQNEPLMLGVMIGAFAGPENAPPEAFEAGLIERIQAAS